MGAGAQAPYWKDEEEEEEKEGGRKKNGDEPLKAQVVDAPLITVGFD